MTALVIAGTASGVGKTTVATGLMGALRARGLRVQAFKVGPDYIDPAYHTRVTGRPSRNLDSWLLPPETLQSVFHRAAVSADVAVVEGVMGLYDGRHGGGDEGSTAEVARLLDLPVVLVVDASRQGRSAAATVLGFQQLDRRVRFVGVILNRVGSELHETTLRAAIMGATGLPVLGALRRTDDLALPERYLGLVPPYERAVADRFFAHAAEVVARAVDVDALLRLATDASPARGVWAETAAAPRAPRATLAIAGDRAFGFYYQDALDLLAAEGLELREFSPLADRALPADAHGVWLGGGFPELFAADLAANREMLASVRQAAQRGMPVYAECGGLMYLARSLADREGRRHAMAGVLPAEVSMQGARLSLGYREPCALNDGLLLRAGETARGHEFHYSRVEYAPERPPAYSIAGRTPPDEGFARESILASYVHLHLAGAPVLASRLAAACAAFRTRVAA